VIIQFYLIRTLCALYAETCICIKMIQWFLLVRENASKLLRISKHILRYICATFHEIRIVYDEMWRSSVHPGWPKLTEVVKQCRKDALCMMDS